MTVFMGVPTMYNYLLNQYDEMNLQQKQLAKKATQRLRLTVSGSAACPVPIMNRWKELSGDSQVPVNLYVVVNNQLVANPSHTCQCSDSLVVSPHF